MHPLEKLTFCPKCGSRHFEVNDFKSRKCDNCGFVFYMNPGAATAAFILNADGRLLVERRAKEPAKGTLDLPGGFVDIGETAEEGIIREVREETSLDITAPKYLFSFPNIYHYSGIDINTLDMFFLCKIEGEPVVMAGDDAAECMWLPLSSIHTELFGLRSIRQALFKFLNL